MRHWHREGLTRAAKLRRSDERAKVEHDSRCPDRDGGLPPTSPSSAPDSGSGCERVIVVGYQHGEAQSRIASDGMVFDDDRVTGTASDSD
jgi:hypothetical protein